VLTKASWLVNFELPKRSGSSYFLTMDITQAIKQLYHQVPSASKLINYRTLLRANQNPHTEGLGKDTSDIAMTIDRGQCHCAGIPLSTFQQGILLKLRKDSRGFTNSVGALYV
jgi:hypothetical protein